jgi:hypothetical protein
MRLLIFLLCAAPVAAQVCGSNFELIHLTQTSATFCASIPTAPSATSTAKVRHGRLDRTANAAPPLDITPYEEEVQPSGQSNHTRVCIVTRDLTPGTTYLAFPALSSVDAGWSNYLGCQAAIAATDCSAYPSNCSIVDDGDGNDIIELITPAGTGLPDDPIPPNHSGRSLSQGSIIDADVFTVTVVDNECTDFTTQFAAAVAARNAGADGETYGVVIPPGVTCRPEHESIDSYLLDATGSNANSYVKVYFGYPDEDAEPPLGGRIDRDPGIGGIEQNLNSPLAVSLIRFASGSNNVVFSVGRVGRPHYSEVNYPSVTVDSVTIGSDTRLNVTPSITGDGWGSASTGNLAVRVPSLRSPWFRGGFHTGQRNTAESFWQRLSGGAQVAPFATFADPGSSGTGVIHWPLSTPFTSATKEPQPTMTFPADHLLTDGFEHSITSITSGVVVVGEAHAMGSIQIPYRPTMLIEGSTGSGCNGFFKINTIQSSTQFTLLSGPASCTGGTIRQVYPVWLHDLGGLPYTGAACLVTFRTTTTAQALLCHNGSASFTPDWTAGDGTITGRLSFDPPMAPTLVDLNNTSNITLDRMRIDGGDAPWRSATLVNLGNSTGAIIAGSFFTGRYDAHRNPLDNTAHANSRVNRFELTINLQCRGCSNVQAINNASVEPGFIWFSPDGVYPSPEDITFDGWTSYTADDMHNQKAASTGLAPPYRQKFEFKNGVRRGKVKGLRIDNMKYDATASPYAIVAQVLPPTNDDNNQGNWAVEDLEISDSFFGGPVGISVGIKLWNPGTAAPRQYGAHRVKIHNNLFRHYPQRGVPSGDILETASAKDNFSGTFVRLSRASQVQITNNTVMSRLSDNQWSPFADIGQHGNSSIVMGGNCISESPTSSVHATRIRAGSLSGWSNVEALIPADGVPSPFADLGTGDPNVVVACQTSPQNHNFAATNNAQSSVETTWNVTGYSTRWPVVAGSNGESCNTRLDRVFAPGTWQPTGDYAAKCADVEAVLDSMGQVRAVSRRRQPGAVEVSFTAPNDDDCKVSYAPAPADWAGTGIGSVMSSAGAREKVVEIFGLSAATAYDFKIACTHGGAVATRVTTP